MARLALTSDVECRAPLTAAELLQHPEFPNVMLKLKPTREGTVAIAAGRGGPFNLWWEIHGEGPRRIVVRHRGHLVHLRSVWHGPGADGMVLSG